MSTTDDPERYVSAVDLRAELPFGHEDYPATSEADFNSALTDALAAASRRVEEWAGATFATVTETATVGRAEHVPEHDLPLDGTPIQSVGSVGVKTDDGTKSLTVGDDVTATDTHLVLTPAGESKLDGGAWPTRDLVAVTYTHGFESAPEPVTEAIVRLARNRLDQIETDGYESDDGGWSYRPPEAIKAECAATVADFSPPTYHSGAVII